MAHQPIRALSRGLHVLEALNRHSAATVRELAEEVGLSRGTVLRLCETLKADGYASRNEVDKTYSIDQRVRVLGGVFDEQEWVMTAAMPVLKRFAKRSIWPVGIATLTASGDRMYVRIHTDTNNVMLVSSMKYNFYISILGSATGQVFLAFLNDKERNAVLEVLETSSPYDEDLIAHDRAAVSDLLQSVRKDGFAVTHSRDEINSRIAVPVLDADDDVIASLAIRYYSSAVNRRTAISTLLPVLEKMSIEIGQRYSAWRTGAA